MNVYEKLMNVQAGLKAPKGQFNSFGKYNYRSCEDILESVKPLLVANKLLLTVDDEVVLIGDRYYIKSTAGVTDIENGERVYTSALAREDETKKGMDLSQVTGSTSSYARKYALNGLFCIDDTKDSDSTNMHGKEGKKADAKLTEKQVSRLYALSKKAGLDKDKTDKHLLSKFNKKVEDLTKEEYDFMCKGYEDKGKVN